MKDLEKSGAMKTGATVLAVVMVLLLAVIVVGILTLVAQVVWTAVLT